jgi:hypothetical protein
MHVIAHTLLCDRYADLISVRNTYVRSLPPWHPSSSHGRALQQPESISSVCTPNNIFAVAHKHYRHPLLGPRTYCLFPIF